MGGRSAQERLGEDSVGPSLERPVRRSRIRSRFTGALRYGVRVGVAMVKAWRWA